MEITRFYQQHELPGLPLIHCNTGDILACEVGDPLLLPLFASRASCGFPSPADDYVDQVLDLNALCVANPTTTFFVRAEGDSMTNAGIDDGDVLVVDRSLEAAHGSIVVALVDDAFTIKYYMRSRAVAGFPASVVLVPANDAYPPIRIHEGQTCEVWGVVTFTIKKAKVRSRAQDA